jgi:hypothetical protein
VWSNVGKSVSNVGKSVNVGKSCMLLHELHVIAQLIVQRTFSHYLPFSTTFCIISCTKTHRISFIYIVNFTWGELIPWPVASWYWYRHHARCLSLGRVDTMTWGELIPWPGASWYHDPGRVDTITRGELIPITACLEVQNRQTLWSLISSCNIVANYYPHHEM